MKQKLIITKLNGHDKEGKIGKVLVKVGEKVASGDVLFTIESGKGSLKFKSAFTGVLEILNVESGDVVTLNQDIGIIEGKEDKKASTGYNFGFSKPAKKELHGEVLIIGGGPGGYVAAIRCAQLGKKVILIEEDRLGGTCLNYGCIPTKALAHSTKVLEHIKHAGDYGFDVPSYQVNIEKIIARKNQVVDTLVGGIEHLMEANNIEVLHGSATVKSENVIQMKNKKVDAEITFDQMIIAVGSEPGFIPIHGHDLPSILTSKEALAIETVPKSITIIGGGVIGMEFAFIFNALGSEVHVIEFMPEILALLDEDVVAVIKSSAEDKGIVIHEGACASSIQESINGHMITSYNVNESVFQITSDKVMMAVGRKARIDSLDLEKLKVSLNEKKNGIAVNEMMKTSNPKIYAIGDVTNILQLAHVASHQGMVAAENIAGSSSKMHYDNVPSAIFTMPEVGHVGLTEKQARIEKIEYKIGKFDFHANGKSIAMNETEGFVKLVFDVKKEHVVGATIVGGHGTDMIATLTNLIEQKVNLQEASSVIYAHPTAAESIHEAILDLQDRGIHSA